MLTCGVDLYGAIGWTPYLSGVQVFFSRYLSVTWTGLPSRKLVVSPVRVREEDVLLSDEGREKFVCVCK